MSDSEPTNAPTRELVDLIVRFRNQFDADSIRALLTDDVELHPPASSDRGPFVGAEAVASALGGKTAGTVFDVDTIRREVHRVIVDDDVAVVLQRLVATTLTGRSYDNEYAWIYTCRDGRVCRIDEYVDTLHGRRQLGTINA